MCIKGTLQPDERHGLWLAQGLSNWTARKFSPFSCFCSFTTLTPITCSLQLSICPPKLLQAAVATMCCLKLLLGIALCVGLVAYRMVYAIPLSQFYDFGGSIGDDVLPRNDDGASSAITLDITFNFFGSNQTSIYVRFSIFIDMMGLLTNTISILDYLTLKLTFSS